MPRAPTCVRHWLQLSMLLSRDNELGYVSIFVDTKELNCSFCLSFFLFVCFVLVLFFRICFYCFCVSYDILSCTFYADSL